MKKQKACMPISNNCPFLRPTKGWPFWTVGWFNQKIFFANQADFKDTFLLIQTTLD